MRAVLQRVSRASVRVDNQTVGSIELGWLILLGVAGGDTERDAQWMADKILGLRAFEDEAGKMNRDAREIQAGLLVVSQFTLLADCRKGRRPSFTEAAPPAQAEQLYEHVCSLLRDSSGLRVECGMFRADMKVELVNDGPVTFVLDSRAGS